MSAGRAGAEGTRATLVVHSSDIHVDDEIIPGTYNGLIGLRAVLETAAAHAADIVLLAGDTFDNARVSTPVLRSAAELLAAAPMPVVLLPGNHDPALEESVHRRAGLHELPRVHVLGITHDDEILFSELGLEIRGRAHRSWHDMPPLGAQRPRAARWRIVMAHGHYVSPADWEEESHRSWRISDAALAATGADYVALGHWDRHAVVGDGSVLAHYSGSPDLAGTVNLVRFAEDAGVSVERMRLPIKTRYER